MAARLRNRRDNPPASARLSACRRGYRGSPSREPGSHGRAGSGCPSSGGLFERLGAKPANSPPKSDRVPRCQRGQSSRLEQVGAGRGGGKGLDRPLLHRLRAGVGRPPTEQRCCWRR